MEADATGAVCHYIHLNPVRSGVVAMEQLAQWPWTSLAGYTGARKRPAWLSVEAALAHAGGLADTPAGRKRYLAYLGWLQEDDAAKQQLAFARMSKDWAVGARSFKMELLRPHKRLEASLKRGDSGPRKVMEELWHERLSRYLDAVKKTARNIRADVKGAAWKVAVASAMKAHSTASNPWLAQRLNMGSPFRLSRLASQCRADPVPGPPSVRSSPC